MESTWETYDVPVLEAAITYAEEHGAPPGATGAQIAEMTGLPVEDVGRALTRLEGEYVKVQKPAGPGPSRWRADGIYADGRRVVGQWPTPETSAERLVAALNQAADAEPDPVQKGKLRRAADAVGSISGQVLAGVVTTYITHATGAT